MEYEVSLDNGFTNIDSSNYAHKDDVDISSTENRVWVYRVINNKTKFLGYWEYHDLDYGWLFRINENYTNE